jgi:hypothetical protein
MVKGLIMIKFSFSFRKKYSEIFKVRCCKKCAGNRHCVAGRGNVLFFAE